MGIMKTLTINGETFNLTPVIPTSSVTLFASAWVSDGDTYSQVVELPGVSLNTKVDLQPTPEQLAEFHYLTLGFVAENEGGVVTVYAIGDKPTNDHTIQTTLTEVEGTGKIRGNTVGTTTPRPDWNQTDPTKADFIKNKPNNYVLTDADKAEIAEMVEGATVVQAPLFVDDTAKMTDTSRVYVLNSTGHIWAYMDTTVEKEVTVTDELDDTTYYDGCRLGGSATSLTDGISNDAAGYHVTPLIDLTKAEYQGKTIQIHLDGAQYITEAIETWIMHRMYKTDGSSQYARGYSCPTVSDGMALWNAEFSINSETSATITVDMPLIFNNDVQVGYLRFCGKGAAADSRIYITYQDVQAVSGGQWVDTGMTYSPVLTDEEKQAIVEEVAELMDAQLLAMVGDGTVTV